jgi:hypothetical protein
MESVRDERFGHTRWRPLPRQPDPQIPVGRVIQTAIEHWRRWQPVFPHDDIRSTCGDHVPRHQFLDQSVRRHRRLACENAVARRYIHCTGVRPLSIAQSKRFELTCELVRCPEIIVVEKRDPSTSRFDNATVASGAHAARAVVADHTNAVAKAPQQSKGVVSRAVVDNDDLKRDVSLRERAAQRQFEQLTAVVGGNDD